MKFDSIKDEQKDKILTQFSQLKMKAEYTQIIKNLDFDLFNFIASKIVEISLNDKTKPAVFQDYLGTEFTNLL